MRQKAKTRSITFITSWQATFKKWFFIEVLSFDFVRLKDEAKVKMVPHFFIVVS